MSDLARSSGTGLLPAAEPQSVSGHSACDPSRWRQGRRVPRNIYRGDEPICMVATAEIAAEMVAALNNSPEMQALFEVEARIESLTSERDYIETRRIYWHEQAWREAARAELAGVGWRPMATAPTNETHVLVARPDHAPIRAYCRNGTWWMHGDALFKTPLEGAFAPTHWMPLPSPPAQGIEARSAETHGGSAVGESPIGSADAPEDKRMGEMKKEDVA